MKSVQKKNSNDLVLTSCDEKKRIHSTAQALLQVFSDGLVLESIRNYIKKGEGAVASLSLQMWQDLLLVQAAAQTNATGQDDEGNMQSQESMLSLVNESRDYLQGILPVHVFLASVSSLIQEGGTSEIRSRALRLVADRATTLDSTSPEASLFVDVLPIILEVLDRAEPCDLVLLQSALVATEHIARALSNRNDDGSDPRKILGFMHFSTALRQCTQLLQMYETPV